MVFRTIARAALLLSVAFTEPTLASEAIAPPAGMKPCPAGDPVATGEARLATKVGGDFLGCFQSGSSVAAATPSQQASTPAAYAFALALHDRTYSVADLRELLSKVEQQWKYFQPLDGKLSDEYVKKLNRLIKEQRDTPNSSVQSIRPTLVKIDKDNDGYYTITSIRAYVVASVSTSVTVIKVNADALIVRNSKLVRLTIQRTLTESADVTRTEAEIDGWARTIAQS